MSSDSNQVQESDKSLSTNIKMPPFEPKTYEFQEEFAIFRVYGTIEAHILMAFALYALQHRGKEVTGMVCVNG